MKTHRILGFVLALGLCGCDRVAPQKVPTRITIAGSTALYPLLAEGAKRYMQAHPDVVVKVDQGGSHVGLAKVAAGEVTLGASDVVPRGPVAAGLVDHRVAVVGYAAVANQGPFNTSITWLSKEEIRDIFTGKIRNWNEIGGDNQPIVVINRAKTSGTRSVFGALALGGDFFVDEGQEQDSNSLVQAMLRNTKGAISYLALSYRDPALITLGYDEVAPTTDDIATGRYPLWSYEHLYTRGAASGETIDFLTFLTSGRFQREVLPGLGFIPLHEMRIVRDDNG